MGVLPPVASAGDLYTRSMSLAGGPGKADPSVNRRNSRYSPGRQDASTSAMPAIATVQTSVRT